MTIRDEPWTYVQIRLHHCATCGLATTDQLTLQNHLAKPESEGHQAAAELQVRFHALPEEQGIEITYSADTLDFVRLGRLPAGPARWSQQAEWSPDDGETGELATRQTRGVTLDVVCHHWPQGAGPDHWQRALDYVLSENDAYDLLSNDAGDYFHDLNDHVLTGTAFRFEPGRRNADGLLSFQGKANRYRAHEDFQGSITTFNQDEDIVEQVRLDITLDRDPDGLLLGRMLEEEGYTEEQ